MVVIILAFVIDYISRPAELVFFLLLTYFPTSSTVTKDMLNFSEVDILDEQKFMRTSGQV